MSAIEHTRGPWRIRAERYRFIRVTATGGGIAHLDTTDGEGMANARLIAAAPDLLAALSRWVAYWDSQTRSEPGADIAKASRAAITKATQGV